jgi:two-component system LytT family response regulator
LLDGKKCTIAKTLKNVEEGLPQHIFFRIHNATVVNLEHVKEYLRSDGGYVIMSNSVQLGGQAKEAGIAGEICMIQ